MNTSVPVLLWEEPSSIILTNRTSVLCFFGNAGVELVFEEEVGLKANRGGGIHLAVECPSLLHFIHWQCIGACTGSACARVTCCCSGGSGGITGISWRMRGGVFPGVHVIRAGKATILSPQKIRMLLPAYHGRSP